MPSLRYLFYGGLPVLSVDETLGLPWTVQVDGALFKSGKGDDSFRVDTLNAGSHTLTLDVVSFPLTRIEIVISPTVPPPPPPPVIEPPPPGGGQKPWGNAYDATPGNCAKGYRQQQHWDPAKRGAYVQCVWDPQPEFTQGFVDGLNTRLDKGFSELAAWISSGLKQVWERLSSIETRISGISELLTQETAERKKDILGIWDKLEGWLVERMVALMLRALDREIEGGK